MIYKGEILKHYDDELDSLPRTDQLLRGRKLKVVHGGYKKLFELHAQHEDSVLYSIYPNISQRDYTEGKEYIRRPDFEVKSALYNPTNPEELSHPISVESSLFITQLLEYCTFVDFQKMNAAMVYKVIDKVVRQNPIPHFYDFLDKGLLQIAMRIRKVIVGPGQYMLKEEFVAVSTTAFNVIFKKLLNEYSSKYGVIPDENAKKLLRDKAISLACDMQDKNGEIIKNPYTLNALNSSDSLLDKNGLDLIYYEPGKITCEFLESPEVKFITDWDGYKKSMYDQYGIIWSDDVIANNMKFNVWNRINTLNYDNRINYSLQEQAYVYRKR